jgi:uncharacterized membrane protein YqaE (UPF0057 family)
MVKQNRYVMTFVNVLAHYCILQLRRRAAGNEPSEIQEEAISMTIVEILLSVFLPPLGVFLAYGISTTLLINILLTLLGWLPGIIHAVWAISKKD